MGANTVQTALLSADYRVLLPLDKHVQVLVIDTREYAFLPQLVEHVKSIDVLLTESDEAYWLAILKTLGLPKLNPIKQLTKEYDLVFSDGLEQLPIRNGGVVCRFFKQRRVLLEKTPLRRNGAWFAWPDWPNFRLLIPDSHQGMRAAVRSVPLYSSLHLGRAMSRWLPSWVTTPRIGEQGIILYQDGEKSAYPSYWEQVVAALGARPGFDFLKTVPSGQCLIGSGTAVNSHIVIHVVDKQGWVQGLIKCTRFPDQSLALEEKRCEVIINLLGSDLADKLMMPGAMINLGGFVVSAYRLQSDWLTMGLRRRLLSYRKLLWAITHWLAKVAYKTAHPLPVSQFWEKHGLPLEHLRDQNLLPTPLKNAADEALVMLEKSSFRAFSVLEHGNLGIHNVQITRKDGQDFRIKDWAGADLEGAPLVDLCYLLASSNASPKLAAQCMGAYLDQTGYPRAMALPLWLSYVARCWQWEGKVVSGDKSLANSANLLRMTRLIHGYVQVLEQKSGLTS
jgi:hypothetical protein